MRLVLQSVRTFQFLHSSPITGEVAFTPSLTQALEFGTVSDWEQARELVDEYFDPGTAIIVDLDADR